MAKTGWWHHGYGYAGPDTTHAIHDLADLAEVSDEQLVDAARHLTRTSHESGYSPVSVSASLMHLAPLNGARKRAAKA